MRISRAARSGFTLIEILIVIAIIGIIAGILVGFLSSGASQATDTTIKSSLEGLRKETSLYFNDDNRGNGSYGAYNTASAVPCTTIISATFLTSALACGDIDNPMGQTGGVCNNPTAIKSRELIQKAVNASGVTPANASRCRLYPANRNDNWVVAVSLKSSPGSSWCVDSLGNSKLVASIPSTAVTNSTNSCPP